MHTDKEDKELLQKMRNLLLSGARMLDEVCPKCGTPLFYIKEVGLKYCPKCDVYVATLEEINNAKIDKSRLKLINMDEVDSVKKNNVQIKEKLEENAEISISINKKVIDAISELVLTTIEKIILIVEKNYEELGIKNLLEILDNAINLLNRMKNSDRGGRIHEPR